MIVVVIKVIEGPIRVGCNYSVKVNAMNPDGKLFNYQFIKNKKEDADKIIQGYSWEMLSEKKWL